MGAATIAKILQTATTLLRDMIKNDGKGIATVVVGIISIFFGLLMLVIIPTVIYERIPVTMTKEQAVWYWQAAKEVTEMTQSPCDDGVYVDWQEVIAIDTVRLKQNFNKSNDKRAKELALKFVEEVGICTHCTGEGEDVVCTDYPVYRLKTIDEVMEELEMQEEQQETVKEKYLAIRYDFLIGFKSESVAGDYDALYSGAMTWPVPSWHSVSSPYGKRFHPVTGSYKMHYGIDIPAPEGTPIIAPSDGQIQSYAFSKGVGWTMVVDHGENERGDRITTRYCHLLENVSAVGKIVNTGEVIAISGNTGYLTTGPHLHFEVCVNGVTVDPAEYFKAR